MADNREALHGEQTPPAVLVVNTLARHGGSYFRAARRALKERGVQLSTSYPVARERDLLRVVRAAVESRARLLVIGGGDGTVSAVSGLLAFREVVLGLLPLGTGNDFARTLGIPLDLEGACRTVVEGHVQEVTLGEVNGHYFLNTVLIGFPGHVNHSVPNWLKRVAGRVAYAAAALYALVASPAFRATITVDGVRAEVATRVVILGNGRFHTPARGQLPAGQADVDRLIVQAPRDARFSTMARLALEFALRGRLNPTLLLAMSGREVIVETDSPQEIDADGDEIGWTPARASLAPGALRVLTPAAAARREDEAHLAA